MVGSQLKTINDLPCRIPSEKAGSWMAFFRKFSIDFNKAALWGIHCIPMEPQFTVITTIITTGRRTRRQPELIYLQHVPARGVLGGQLCIRWSDSDLQPEDVDGPGLLSIATSDTMRIHNVDVSILLNSTILKLNLKVLWLLDKSYWSISLMPQQWLTLHVCVHILSFHSCIRPLDLWLDDKRALFPWQVNLMLQTEISVNY